MRGDAQREIQAMNKGMMREGGGFDHFAGKDGHMTLDEARQMNEAVRQGFKEHFGEKVPAYTNEQF